MRGLWKLTWLEIKIFVREPLGLVGSIAIPAIMFVVLGRMLSRGGATVSPQVRGFVALDLPVFAAILIALSAVLSLVTIVSIYREGGILKRLRATPLRPHTILTAHVIVKLLMTAAAMGLMALAGRRYYPLDANVGFISFTFALLLTTTSILSIGFVIASLVPTARFAQPMATLILYLMLGISGLFIPVAALPPALQVVSRFTPLTYAVSLLKGIWRGDGWWAHTGDVTTLVLIFALSTAVSAKVFRWE
jgi:ABC-2 type transport system permease protein